VPFNLSTGELLVLLLVAVVVFGGKLPNVARKVGSTISDFKRGMRDEMRRVEDDLTPPPDWTPPDLGGEVPGKDDEPAGK
jgi:sec-independent protein translocase protein TatA